MFHASRDGILFTVQVTPRAKRDEISRVTDDVVKIRLNAPPVEGRANEALIKFLADRLDIPRGQVEIVRGETSRRKVVRVRGVSVAQIKAIIKA